MRDRQLKILNIDGVRGVGKSTQLNILANLLKRHGRDVKINQIMDREGLTEAIKNTIESIQENDNAIILNDGSIASFAIQELSKGTSNLSVESIYGDDLFDLQTLNHSVGMVNVILVPESLEYCKENIKRQRRLQGIEFIDNIDPVMQSTLIDGFDNFNNNVISRELAFKVLPVDSDDSILKIHYNILDAIESKGFYLGH